MKTILLWDPRFPDRRPSRLTVEDTVASAAVRAGVAAAANPAEAGALSAGGALDPTMLTEVVLQHGSGSATRRVFLPYSVVMVGAAAGVLAAIGTPIPGGVTPTPTPTLTLSAASPLIASNAAAGTLVSNISNVPAGATPTVTPNDGRLVIAGDSSAGWKVVVGMSALSAGTVNFSVAATGATGASGMLTITAVASSLRTMAGGGVLPDGASTVTAGVTRVVGRAQIPVFATTTDMKIAFPIFHVADSAGEIVSLPQAGTTFSAQLEDSNGSLFGAITFENGQAKASTFPASGVFWTDTILPAVLGRSTFATGTTTLFVKMEWEFPSTGTNRIFVADNSGGSTGVPGEGVAYGGTTTMGVYGAATGGGGSTQSTRIFRPWLVVGTHGGVALAFVGDSLTFGQGDAKAGTIGSDGAGGGAFARAGYASAIPYTKIGKPADRIQYWAGNAGANSANRIDAMRYHTHTTMMLGFNDIAGGSNTAAQVLDNLRLAWGRMRAVNPALKVLEGFIIIRTASSDSWATQSGQTVQGGYETGGVRTAFNNSLAAEVSAGTIFGTFDLVSSINDPAAPDKWLTNGTANYPTTDGTHARPTFHGLEAAYLRSIFSGITV